MMYFVVSGLDNEENRDETINTSELTLDPYNILCTSLLYAYGMETYLHETIAMASVALDDVVGDTLGPFLKCVQIMVSEANQFRYEVDPSKENSLYRPLCISKATMRDL